MRMKYKAFKSTPLEGNAVYISLSYVMVSYVHYIK